jgi:prolyl 4-hydroxylase
MPLNLGYPGLRRVHERPPIFVCDHFLSDAECAHLMRVATPMLQRSKTHAVAGSEATRGRTSLTCHLAKSHEPCPGILRKIQALTNKPLDHMELPQVARYTDGQRYVEHYDGVDPGCAAGQAFCASGGQRIGTVLMYLKEPKSGGGTFFRRLNLEIQPKRGSAVIFFPGFMNGELDLDALHAGLPPVGTKCDTGSAWPHMEGGRGLDARPVAVLALT